MFDEHINKYYDVLKTSILGFSIGFGIGSSLIIGLSLLINGYIKFNILPLS